MPGRTPVEAVKNYVDPLQTAVSCLQGVAKILLTQRVQRIGDHGAWILNGPDGMPLPRFGTFYAQQRFELVETSQEYRDYEPVSGTA